MQIIQQELHYNLNELEPFISSEIMDLHFNKHHSTYIKNVNDSLLKYPELKFQNIDELIINLNNLPEDIKKIVRNNLGGHLNHELFWRIMTPNASSTNFTDNFTKVINETFDSYKNFIILFKKECNSFFGSGWVWLCLNSEKKLEILSFINQEAPIFYNLKPILGIDLWEHSYYLQYKNKRSEYIDIFLNNLINKDFISNLII